MANMKESQRGWLDIITSMGLAVNPARLLALWHTIPWIIGWATLTMMGPYVAVKMAYNMSQMVMSRLFSSDRALCGKVVLITGASSGLGEALAHAFYKRGARVILASRSVDKLNKIKDDLLESYKPLEVHVPTVTRLDLEDLNSIQAVVDGLLKSHGHIDILINNAGISFRGQAVDTDISVDIKLMVVNYFGQVALTKAILPNMMDKKSGHIVAVGSVQGKLAIPYRSCYTASKHALQGFFDCLRAEVADSNIKVSIVNPGYIATNLSLNAVTGDGSTYGQMDAATSSGMTPEEVAEQIISCVKRGYEEVVVAPLTHRMAINLRTLAPSVVSHIMRGRAVSQRNMYAHKED